MNIPFKPSVFPKNWVKNTIHLSAPKEGIGISLIHSHSKFQGAAMPRHSTSARRQHTGQSHPKPVVKHFLPSHLTDTWRLHGISQMKTENVCHGTGVDHNKSEALLIAIPTCLWDLFKLIPAFKASIC